MLTTNFSYIYNFDVEIYKFYAHIYPIYKFQWVIYKSSEILKQLFSYHVLDTTLFNFLYFSSISSFGSIGFAASLVCGQKIQNLPFLETGRDQAGRETKLIPTMKGACVPLNKRHLRSDVYF